MKENNNNNSNPKPHKPKRQVRTSICVPFGFVAFKLETRAIISARKKKSWSGMTHLFYVLLKWDGASVQSQRQERKFTSPTSKSERCCSLWSVEAIGLSLWFILLQPQRSMLYREGEHPNQGWAFYLIDLGARGLGGSIYCIFIYLIFFNGIGESLSVNVLNSSFHTAATLSRTKLPVGVAVMEVTFFFSRL